MMKQEAVASAPAPNNDDGDVGLDEHYLDADEWRDELKEVLDGIDKKGDFCVGKDVTSVIPRFQPSITVDGLDDDEQLAFPLPTSQAKLLRSIAVQAPFGKGLDTVLDESVRKAWQIDADKVHFRDPDQWRSTLQSIVSDFTSSLGMLGGQKESVSANLYKMLLYEQGGHFKRHRDTEKEPGMFGTLIIQLPSNFTGGKLVVEHSGEKVTYDFSSKSSEGIFATAFYADCEHELLPVESGWRICLAYNLVIPQNDTTNTTLLPTASALIGQLHQVQKLTSNWNTLFDHPLGYMLEHNYTETNLHFANLKGRDKEVVDFLRGGRDQNGNPLFVVCMMLIEKHESGQPESSGCYGYRRRYDSDSDSGDHTMGEVYETDIGIKNWVGPDDKVMRSFNLRFDIDDHLLTDEDTEDIFGEGQDPTRQEYESYTGNAGPTLDYWYHVASVVFWPRLMNMKVLKSAGDSYLVSYLNVAMPSEIVELGIHIVKLLEDRKIQMSATILSGLVKANDERLVLRALKCCQSMPSSEFARALASVPSHFKSDDVSTEIIQIAKNTVAAKKQHLYSNVPMPYALDFLEALEATGDLQMIKEARENIVVGAVSNIVEVGKCTKIDLLCKNALKCKTDTFEAFCSAVKVKRSTLPSILKSFISLGETATKHPLVIDLAVIMARKLKEKTSHGPPPFSWKMPIAVFPGSQGAEVTPFLRGDGQTQTFYCFNGIAHARNWGSKYFGGVSRAGHYSAEADAGGRGRDAYVTVTKTRAYHEMLVALYNAHTNELKELVNKFGDKLNADISDTAEENGHEGVPTLTWRQPDAIFPGSNSNEVDEFLHGEEKSHTFYHFNDIGHAQNWAYKYFGGHGQGTGYSARAFAGQNSSGAYVTVTKTEMTSEDGPPEKRQRGF